MAQVLNFHKYFQKEFTYFFYAMTFLGLLGNLIDLVLLGADWKLIFIVYNVVTILLLLINAAVFLFKKSRLKPAFAFTLYTVYLNLIASNATDIYFGETYSIYLLRETIFVCFLLTAAFMFVGQLHGLIVGISFSIYFITSVILSKDNFLLSNIFTILAVFLSYVVILSFFESFLNRALIRIQEDSQLIREQNEELSAINQELKSVNEELGESQKQINAQHEELITLSESLYKQNEELGDKNNMLEDAIHQKTKFFSIVAHDLKSPISSITSLTQQMLENYDNMTEEKKKNWLSKILSSTKLLFELLENLLMWSRSQTGMIELNPELIELDETVEKVFSIYKNYASNKSIKLEKNIDSKIHVNADRMMVETIIRNITSNAIKYSFENHTVFVSAEIKGQYVIVTVIDEGVGMSPAKVKTIFSFDDNSISLGTSGEKGTGLGLRLCKEFIEKHNGTIRVESIKDKGTSISFSLPKVVKAN